MVSALFIILTLAAGDDRQPSPLISLLSKATATRHVVQGLALETEHPS